MPFTPKFVDLVRNVTTVQGSGPVALGAAVPGYAGFAETITVGEQFYYCIQGVDKPAEREVGRGTMQAGSTILREPIGGVATSFTGGTKTIALVAAAEWFARIELGSGAGAGGGASCATRALLAARSGDAAVILTEDGREGIFVFSAANLSSLVAADINQGLAIAPASAPSGSAGAWLRRFSGAVNVRWFGATGNGTTDDGAAFVAALAALKAVAANDAGIYKGSDRLRIPAGHYYLGSTTIDITHTLIVEGEGNGQQGGKASRLRWAAGATGLRVQRANTSGAGAVDAVNHYGGDGTTIRGLTLQGGYTDFASEGAFHGIHLKARATIEDCVVHNFQGNGIHIVAYAGGGVGIEGNANCFFVNRVACLSNQNGIYLDGADANAGSVFNADVSYNRQWGIWDSSFLGNTIAACHSAENGTTSDAAPYTIVSFSGRRYYVRSEQAAGASSNAPSGTSADNSYWGYAYDGGPMGLSVPTWTNGIAVREGGAYKTDDPSCRTTFLHCYAEGGQGPSQLTGGSLVVGGTMASGLAGYGGVIGGGQGAITVPRDLNVGQTLTVSGSTYYGPTTGSPQDVGIYFNNTSNYSNLYFRSWFGGAEQIDATLTAQRDLGFIIDNRAGCYVRVNGSNILRCNNFNVDVLKAGAKLGYGDGTGGAVVQATSKATGVTLSKTNGQITLNGAALAGSTSVSFTLTNGVIAATDTLIVNIGSGATAGAYAVGVDAVADGSCRIHLRNLSAGALSEAVTLNFAVIKAVAA